MTPHNVGFIGLGIMGLPMALNLIAAGHRVTVWNRNRDKCAPALKQGARLAPSPAQLARDSEFILLCVTDTGAVEDIVFGADGVADGIAAENLLIDHSTIHPLQTRAFAARLKEATGTGWVDAPVSGGAKGASEGTLIVMAGGAESDVERARPVVGAFARRLTRMGPVGSGQAAKVCNQMIIGAAVAVCAEALKFADEFGMDAAALPDCLAGGWADSAVLQNHARRMAAADYGEASTGLTMLKDMNIACDMGRATNTPMPITAAATALYALLIAQGHADKGQIGLMRLYADGPLGRKPR